MRIVIILAAFCVILVVGAAKLHVLLTQEFPRMEKHLASVTTDLPPSPAAYPALSDVGIPTDAATTGAIAAEVVSEEAPEPAIVPTPPVELPVAATPSEVGGYQMGEDPDLPPGGDAGVPVGGNAVIGNVEGSANAAAPTQAATDGRQFKGDDWTKAFDKTEPADSEGKKKKKDKDTDKAADSWGSGAESSDIWSGLYKKLEAEAQNEKKSEPTPALSDDGGSVETFDAGEEYFDEGDYDY